MSFLQTDVDQAVTAAFLDRFASNVLVTLKGGQVPRSSGFQGRYTVLRGCPQFSL